MPSFLAAAALAAASLFSCATFAQSASPEPMAAADWLAAIGAAKAGDTLDLGSRPVQFARKTLAPAACCVTIKGGVFKGAVTFDGWKNVVIDGSHFALTDNDGSYAIGLLFYSPANVTVRDVTFTGTVSPSGNLSVAGVSVRGGSNVAIERSRFVDTSTALSFQKTDGVLVQDNDLTNIGEGIDLNGVQHVRILRNRIGPFHVARGAHADGVQNFTTNLTGAADKATQDLLAADNLVIGGTTAQTRTQCFFNGDELNLSATPDRGYRDMTFRDNICLGAGWHGISFPTAVVPNLLIEGNRLYKMTGADTVKDVWIMAQNGTVRNNLAGSYKLGAAVVQEGNVSASADVTPADYAKVIADWDARFRAVEPAPSKALERAQKARLEVNDLKNTAARALYAIDQLIAELSGGK